MVIYFQQYFVGLEIAKAHIQSIGKSLHSLLVARVEPSPMDPSRLNPDPKGDMEETSLLVEAAFQNDSMHVGMKSQEFS